MRLPLAAPLLPARALLQALDDVHAIAEAARRLPTIEATLTEQFALLNQQADQVVGIGERILALGERIEGLGERIDGRARQIIELGDRIDTRAEQILQHAHRLDGRAGEVLEESARIREAAHEVADRGAEVAAALPALQQIVTTTEPLQGAIERFGRIVDRLPGGERRP